MSHFFETGYGENYNKKFRFLKVFLECKWQEQDYLSLPLRIVKKNVGLNCLISPHMEKSLRKIDVLVEYE